MSGAPQLTGPLLPIGQAGHPFHLRCAHSAYSHARLKQEAPVFLLFLDCVGQLGRQFPFSLEFSERLLLALFENSYASAYGTFLCNSEKERQVPSAAPTLAGPWAGGMRMAFSTPSPRRGGFADSLEHQHMHRGVVGMSPRPLDLFIPSGPASYLISTAGDSWIQLKDHLGVKAQTRCSSYTYRTLVCPALTAHDRGCQATREAGPGLSHPARPSIP